MLGDGHPVAAIERAGREAYGIPIGFLALMDATGLPIGLASMQSFSDRSDASDPLTARYGNFFVPPVNYVELISRLERSEDPRRVRWIEDPSSAAAPADAPVVAELADRFRAIGFITATECVEAGLITVEDLELLAQNAFVWPRGPYALMRDLGSARVARAVSARIELAKRQGQDLPISDTLQSIVHGGALPAHRVRLVLSEPEMDGAARRITLSNPRAANAMDNTVFAELRAAFDEAHADPKCRVIIFDTAPIKTFIAGAHVPTFVERIRRGAYEEIRRDTTVWQDVIFNVMTGRKKPTIAIVDGAALGGGVEVALAFAADPATIVVGTNRTTFALPETRLGIFPGLRGTLTLPEVIHRATGDNETAVALAKYFILSGLPASSAMLQSLGMLDVVAPAHRRDAVAATIARAILASGRVPTAEELASLDIETVPTRLTRAERDELDVARDVFLSIDLIPTLYAYARGHAVPGYTGERRRLAERAARRVADNSPHAVAVADWLIGKGFADGKNGATMDERAAYELETHLEAVFEHPDAREGLSAMLDRRAPRFARRYPFEVEVA
jgi:enoyl-CoA hydratase/carnithine racemase